MRARERDLKHIFDLDLRFRGFELLLIALETENRGKCCFWVTSYETK